MGMSKGIVTSDRKDYYEFECEVTALNSEEHQERSSEPSGGRQQVERGWAEA